MSKWKEYRKAAVCEMRPYVIDEDLSNITVSEADIPCEGGMIVRDINNIDDQWYISEKYFNANYVKVE